MIREEMIRVRGRTGEISCDIEVRAVIFGKNPRRGGRPPRDIIRSRIEIRLLGVFHIRES